MLMPLSECLLLHIYNGDHTKILLLDMDSCGADIDAEQLGLLPAKIPKITDWKKCLICELEKKETLLKASATAIIALLAASKQRRDEVFERIEAHAEELQSRKLYGMQPVMDHTPTKEILVLSPW